MGRWLLHSGSNAAVAWWAAVLACSLITSPVATTRWQSSEEGGSPALSLASGIRARPRGGVEPVGLIRLNRVDPHVLDLGWSEARLGKPLTVIRRVIGEEVTPDQGLRCPRQSRLDRMECRARGCS